MSSTAATANGGRGKDDAHSAEQHPPLMSGKTKKNEIDAATDAAAASAKPPVSKNAPKAAAESDAAAMDIVESNETEQSTARVSTSPSSNMASANENPGKATDEKPSTRKEVMEVLEGSSSVGSTFVGGPAPGLPAIPGLVVEGMGSVPLPVTLQIAAALVGVAKQSSTAHIWEIEASKVSLSNPAWDDALQKLVSEASAGLGVDTASVPSVQAELDKLLLFEPGSTLPKKQPDTKKTSKGKHFATLVVRFPSNHSGGAFILSYDGTTKKFPLGCNGEAAFGCHYTAFYNDCELETEKIESGHRVALVYSLLVTDPDGAPEAADVHEKLFELRSALTRLPAWESIFLVPLRHSYGDGSGCTPRSLARFGAKGLGTEDQELIRSIAVAGENSWETLIVEGEKRIVDREDATIVEAYGTDGSDRTASLNWLRGLVNLDLVVLDDDGMLLGDEDDFIEMWEHKSVETTRDGSVLETYKAFFCLAYSKEAMLDRMCHGELSSAISYVVQAKDQAQTDKVLDYISRSKASLEPLECERLLSSILSAATAEARDTADDIGVCLGCLRSTDGGDDLSPAFSRMASQVLAFCSEVKDSPHELSILERVFNNRTFDISVFLWKARLAGQVSLNSNVEGLQLLPLVAVRFKPREAEDVPDAPLVATFGRKVLSLVDDFGWSMTKAIASKCIEVFLKETNDSLDAYFAAIDLVESLTEKSSESPEATAWCQIASEAFVSKVEGSGKKELSSLLLSTQSDKAVLMLFKYCDAQLLARLEQWMSSSTSSNIDALEELLARVFATYPGENNRETIQQLLDKMRQLKLEKKLSSLRKKQTELVEATRKAPPVFSWCMPDASFPADPKIEAFLRGPESAMQCEVASGKKKAKKFRRDGSKVQNGFSAEMSVTSNNGRCFSVDVSKTRALFDSQTKAYEEKTAQLVQVNKSIAELEQQLEEVTSGQPTRPIDSVPDSQASMAPPAKKQRVEGPVLDA